MSEKCLCYQEPHIHPANINHDEPIFVCENKDHPEYDPEDFEPIPKCNGNKKLCDITHEYLNQKNKVEKYMAMDKKKIIEMLIKAEETIAYMKGEIKVTESFEGKYSFFNKEK